MLTTDSAAALESEILGDAMIRPSGCGTHSPDPDTIGRSKPVAVVFSNSDSERILADFKKAYVGAAHGIDKAELQALESGKQRIVVSVYDWNGIINIPEHFQGMAVSFIQSVPAGASWQL